MECRAGCQGPVITNSQNDKHFTLMALMDLTATSPESRNEAVCKTNVCTHSSTAFVAALTISYATMAFVTLDASFLAGTPSMMCFQMNLDSVCSIMMTITVFGGVENVYSQHTFDIVLLLHHLESWNGLPLVTHLGTFRIDGTLNNSRCVFVVLIPVILPFIRDLRNATF